MASPTSSEPKRWLDSAALDQELRWLDAEDLEFYKSQTGIYDEDVLRAHIVHILSEIYPYTRIGPWAFTVRLKPSFTLDRYEEILEIGRTRKSAILLDVGGHLGTSVRKFVEDGYPVRNTIAVDGVRHRMWWFHGHRLFRSTPETFPVAFVAGDILDPDFLPIGKPGVTPATAKTQLRSLVSLRPLVGTVSVVHVLTLFHMFDEDEQVRLAHACASLLSPQAGSMIIGAQPGMEIKGHQPTDDMPMFPRSEIYCHSPESWTALWDGQIFPKGSVSVHAKLRSSDYDVRRDCADIGVGRYQLLDWTVIRY